MNPSDLHAYAKTFPSQGGVEIGPWLEKYASEVPRGSAIVEVGSWLGAGTAYLALGAMQNGAEIHVYDRFFCVSEEEKTKAARFGIDLLVGENTLPRVQGFLARFPAKIHYHKGSIKKGSLPKSFVWPSLPIGLYVDDATKIEPIWSHAMSVFKPHFIPGKTILVLMDYHFDLVVREQGKTNWQNYSAQRSYMAKHASEFELVEDRIGGTTAAVWRYLG